MKNVKRMDKVSFYLNNSVKKGVVIQNNIGNKYAPTTIVIEYSEIGRKKFTFKKPYLLTKEKGSKILFELPKIYAISKERIKTVDGRLEKENQKKLQGLLERVTRNNEFEVLFAKLGNGMGSEQTGNRPVLYLKNIGLVIPFTTKKLTNTLPIHTCIIKNNENGLSSNSVLLAEHMKYARLVVFQRKMGKISKKSEVKRIKEILTTSILKD